MKTGSSWPGRLYPVQVEWPDQNCIGLRFKYTVQDNGERKIRKSILLYRMSTTTAVLHYSCGTQTRRRSCLNNDKLVPHHRFQPLIKPYAPSRYHSSWNCCLPLLWSWKPTSKHRAHNIFCHTLPVTQILQNSTAADSFICTCNTGYTGDGFTCTGKIICGNLI